MKKTACFALAASFAAGVAAQAPSRPHPAEPKAEAAVQPHEPPLRGYRAYAETEVGRWKDANRAGEPGGHAGHAAAPGPAMPAEKPAAKSPAKAPAMHHHHHGGHQ